MLQNVALSVSDAIFYFNENGFRSESGAPKKLPRSFWAKEEK